MDRSGKDVIRFDSLPVIHRNMNTNQSKPPKSRLSEEHLKPTPNTPREVAEFICQVERYVGVSGRDVDALEVQLKEQFSLAFNYRDEANALIARVVRNGPIEDLHASLSPTTGAADGLRSVSDEEMRIMMISHCRMLAPLLMLRDINRDAYYQFILRFGGDFCGKWERWESKGSQRKRP